MFAVLARGFNGQFKHAVLPKIVNELVNANVAFKVCLKQLWMQCGLILHSSPVSLFLVSLPVVSERGVYSSGAHMMGDPMNEERI